jgi:hypothetical protein
MAEREAERLGALALQAANRVRTEGAASVAALTEVAAREVDAAIRTRAEADQESETVRAQAAEHVSKLIETARRDADAAQEARSHAYREAEQIVAEAQEEAARLRNQPMAAEPEVTHNLGE